MPNTKHLETKNGEKNLYVVNDLSKNENVACRTMLMCASVMEIQNTAKYLHKIDKNGEWSSRSPC